MNKLAKLSIGMLFGAMVVTLALSVGSRAGLAAPTSKDAVTICHFPSHDVDTRLGTTSEKAVAGCAAAGGNAVTITITSCENGHEAISKKGTIDCRPDDDGATAPPAEPADPAKPPV
jgi:hypothetical protein